MGRTRSNSPAKKDAGTARTSSPCSSKKTSNNVTEQCKEEGGDTTTKAAATVPTTPQVTRSKASTQAKLPTKGGGNDNSIGANENNKGKIVDEQNLSKNDELKSDEKEESKDGREESEEIGMGSNGKPDSHTKSKKTSGMETIDDKIEPEIDGSGKSSDELSLSSHQSSKTKAFNAGKLYIQFSCSYFDSNKCFFFLDKMRKFPKEIIEKVR